MNKKKTFIVIALAVVVLVVLGVVAFGNKVAKAPENSAATSSVSSNTVTQSTTTAASAPESYSNGSFSFSHPASWSIVSARPLLMTNFNGQYKAGGVIPANGIQLAVATTTAYGSVQDIIATELMSATHLTTSTVTVDNVSCAKEAYQVNYAPGAIAQNISVYCSRGTALWKIYFSYPANDPAEAVDVSDFNGVLGSMKLSG
jgi:hypothetical protein